MIFSDGEAIRQWFSSRPYLWAALRQAKAGAIRAKGPAPGNAPSEPVRTQSAEAELILISMGRHSGLGVIDAWRWRVDATLWPRIAADVSEWNAGREGPARNANAVKKWVLNRCTNPLAAPKAEREERRAPHNDTSRRHGQQAAGDRQQQAAAGSRPRASVKSTQQAGGSRQ